MNNIFDSDFDVEESSPSSSTKTTTEILNGIEVEFNDVLDNILADISNVDIKIADIQRYITILDANIEMLERRIRKEKDVSKKINMQRALNGLLQIMVSYQDALQKFLNLKHNYRESQSRCIRDKYKLELDAVKSVDKDKSDLTVSKLIELFSNLQNTLASDSNKREILESLEDLEDNEVFSLK